ncbi:hypothetical protein [Curtanaerobium respiraculi]|uniref:hypothetical protein n=1 Tax=Curtanaerobium respiraculi TaxID=2949669 RepID=UPI0024B327DD|nr:hypothetical protein [Curtanaerobium respiraculi]
MEFAIRLGSGVRNLFKYSSRYSGADPRFIEGDVFRTILPLDDDYSFDARIGADASDRQAIKWTMGIGG